MGDGEVAVHAVFGDIEGLYADPCVANYLDGGVRLGDRECKNGARTMSRRSYCSHKVSPTRLTSTRLARSHWMNLTSGENFSRVLQCCSSCESAMSGLSSSRARMSTRALAEASAFAISKPLPCVAPVIKAT